MLLKHALRSVNNRIRRAPLYDKIYRRFHAAYRLRGQDENAAFYHAHFNAVTVAPGLVLLDAFWGRIIGCNPYALYVQMRSDPRCAAFRYIWVCNDETVIPAGMRDDPAVSFVAYQSPAYQTAMLQAQYLIGNSNFPQHFIKKHDQIYVNTWHGTPIKHLGRDAEDAFVPSANTQRNYFCSDYILSYSPAMTQRTVMAYGAAAALDRVYEVGTPRIDLTLATSRAHARSLLGAADDKQVLLYAPTWRGSFGRQNSDIQEQIETIEAVLDQFSDRFDVFVSVHHITAIALKEKGITFRMVPVDVPINIALAGIDLLISDYSSIAVDYLSLDRPVVLFCPDYESFRTTQGLYDDLRELPVALCETLEDLTRAVLQARKPSDFASYVHHRAKLVECEDGGVSGRVLDIILNKTAATAYPNDSRKRILFYAGGMFPNGITSSIVALTNAIDHDRYDVSVVFDAAATDKNNDRQINIQKLHPACKFVTRTGAITYTAEEREAYRVFCEKGVFQNASQKALVDTLFDREVARIFGNQRYDVAIDFSGYGPFWTTVLSKVKADRHLIYQQSDMYREAYNQNAARSFPELPAVFSLYARFDGVIAVTQAISAVNRQNLQAYYGPNTDFLVAQNVVLADVIKAKSEIPLGLVSAQVASVVEQDAPYLFCCVARLSPEKNHARLLAAFAQVQQVNPNCALLILGSGKIEQNLRKQVMRLGIKDHVMFLGHCENPYPIIRACDCMVLASDYEGQGIVLLEALTLGVRCIATDNPAIQSVLKDGIGTIVPQDTDALAVAMLEASRQSAPNPVVFDAQGYSASALQQFYTCLEN